MYTNSDQLLNKRDDLSMAIAGREPDVIMVTEVIPKAQTLPIDPAVLAIPGYSMFTSFEPSISNLGKSGTRGICIYTRDCIRVAQVRFAHPILTEHIWLQISLKGSDKLLLGCVYRSPSCDSHQSVDELVRLLHEVNMTSPSHLLVTGDFNLPQINWATSFCSAPESHHAHKFLAAVHDCLLFQHVTQPTRFRDGVAPSLLDLVITNEEGMLTNLQYLPGLGKSDHVVLDFGLACYTAQSSFRPARLNFHRANFLELNRKIAMTDWDSLISSSVDDGYNYFKGTVDHIVTSCIPEARSSHSKKNIYMTSNALKLRKRKNVLWQQSVRTKDPLDVARFRASRNRLRHLTRKLRRQFETQLVVDIKRNPKAFWRYSNSRLRTKPRIGDLRDASGMLVSEGDVKAGLLSTYFSSVFTSEDQEQVPTLAS